MNKCINQNGMVLLVTLCWLVVINLMAVTVLELAKQQGRLLQYQADQSAAFYAATDAMHFIRDHWLSGAMNAKGRIKSVDYQVVEQYRDDKQRGYLVTVRSQVDHSQAGLQAYYVPVREKLKQCWWRQDV